MTSAGYSLHARDSIIGLCRQALPYQTFVDRMLHLLRKAVPFDRGVLLMVDPETVMPTGGVVTEFAAGVCTPLWENEFSEPDVAKFASLPSNPGGPAQSLHQATGGVLTRSHRYRTLYQEMNVGDELRATFISGGTCWGLAALLRDVEGSTFSATETAFLAEMGPHIADGLRRTVLAEAVEGGSLGPGTMVFDGAGRIEMMTAEAAAWLDELELDAAGEKVDPVTMLLSGVAARARRVALGQDSQAAFLRARTRTGRWLTVHASCLFEEGRPNDRVAVIVQPSRDSDLAPLLVEAYDLTPREREVLELLAHGLTSKEIARRLRISVHTARDHVKVILDKVQVRSRGELVARIFWQHAHDRVVERLEQVSLDR